MYQYLIQPQPVELIVMFTPEGTEGALPWTQRELNSSEGHAAFAFDLELPGAGLLELCLPNDALPYDNQAQFQLKAAPRTVRVLHIGPDNPPLQRALEAIDGVELFRADALPEESEEFDLMVIDRITLPSHPRTHTIWLGRASFGGEAPPPLTDPVPTGWETSHPLSTSVD